MLPLLTSWKDSKQSCTGRRFARALSTKPRIIAPTPAQTMRARTTAHLAAKRDWFVCAKCISDTLIIWPRNEHPGRVLVSGPSSKFEQISENCRRLEKG